MLAKDHNYWYTKLKSESCNLTIYKKVH